MPVETFIPRSTNIASAAYDSDARELVVSFVDGNTYRYFAVPDSVFGSLKRARSAGSYFYNNIRSVYNFSEE